MSGATIMQIWGDTLVTTALLVLAVLLVRKPFARQFGPRLTYALWLVPALRLVLPPLPFADPVAVPAAATVPADVVLIEAADAARTIATPAAIPQPSWGLTDALPLLFALWTAGALLLIATAIVRHMHFRRLVLDAAVALEPIGSIRLVMSGAVDGPVAFGLFSRYVAVPHDFFARYAAEERALAIDHELAHHRHGDLWANSAALLLLASQWFNPLAWRAIRAFRFDQEAACDARVLTMADTAERRVRTAHYAAAIAKAAVGARLSLAAPMAVHDNLQERLTMLMQQDISKQRRFAGKLLVGSATLAVLGATATLVPAGTATAHVQDAGLIEPPAPPAPPAAPDAPPAPPAPVLDGPHRIMIVTTHGDDESETVTTSADGPRREVNRVVVRQIVDGDGKAERVALAPGTEAGRRFELRFPGNLSRDDILATLKEQGIGGARADAIADKLEAKRTERFRTALAPVPPMPPLPPMPPMGEGAWRSKDGKAMAMATCKDGQKSVRLFSSDEQDQGGRNRMVMMVCGDAGVSKADRVAALKKARDRLAADSRSAMSGEMRAKVIADMDRAIAEAEKGQ
ncbi:M56 family metallopeptidase [uncultured Sphingopyxis sp.]|jgi:beta-lactamase regulating signal transducer with metallopeptidase domain|uniref:M56 family metallopeptidase n=1 Tax=uncultured Sphingopyxis sp. TaxID=310581 RepID=UPI000AC8E877|nr:M56 family metallopeptidase [uncultured Sphingopyxis sp.]